MNDDEQRELLAQASWLLSHARYFANGVVSWPRTSPVQDGDISYLSASTQGNALSVLVRAYQLTGNEEFLHMAQGVVRAFELDILDGGVNTPLGDNGGFFEEIAVYPASHALKAHLLALLGLYDYQSGRAAITGMNKFMWTDAVGVAGCDRIRPVHCAGLTRLCVATGVYGSDSITPCDPYREEERIETLLQRGLAGLNTVLDAFDSGSWTRFDLLHGRLASASCHAQHVMLLQQLADRSACSLYATAAARWRGYRQPFLSRLRHVDNESLAHPAHPLSHPYRVCVPITAFPVPGGMRSVLTGVAQAMANYWQMSYLTHHKGQDVGEQRIEVFGRRFASPWNFPQVWPYCISGGLKLLSMLRKKHIYQLVLPQDGVFTGAFAAFIGRLKGMYVVCMDHGNVTWLNNALLRMERMQQIQTYPKMRRMLARLYLSAYIFSLRLFAQFTVRWSNLFLVAGDEVEEVYRHFLGVHAWRIIRYVYTVDTTRFTPCDSADRARIRAAQGLADDAIVVSMINRLAPEKGLHYALAGIAQAMTTLPSTVRARVKVLIAGEGPLRSQVEADIRRYGLDTICVLWGNATPADVVMLLGISDIFLYTGTRGTNYSMAVLEAMAAGCAVIASVSPQSNATLLAEERGIPIPTGDASAIEAALTRLCGNTALCQQMGRAARGYVAIHHSEEMLKRTLLRASFYTPPLQSSLDD